VKAAFRLIPLLAFAAVLAFLLADGTIWPPV
jgi:hypothetical protein